MGFRTGALSPSASFALHGLHRLAPYILLKSDIEVLQRLDVDLQLRPKHNLVARNLSTRILNKYGEPSSRIGSDLISPMRCPESKPSSALLSRACGAFQARLYECDSEVRLERLIDSIRG